MRGSVFSGIGVGLGCKGFAAHETEPSLTELGMSIFSLLTVQQHFSVESVLTVRSVEPNQTEAVLDYTHDYSRDKSRDLTHDYTRA